MKKEGGRSETNAVNPDSPFNEIQVAEFGGLT